MRFIATTVSIVALGAAMLSGCGAEDETLADSEAFQGKKGGHKNCGNGQIDRHERCDGQELGGATCASVTMGVRPNGVLRCNRGCQFDTSGCRRGPGGGGGSGGGSGGACDWDPN